MLTRNEIITCDFKYIHISIFYSYLNLTEYGMENMNTKNVTRQYTTALFEGNLREKNYWLFIM